jgi:hypothetical protein
MMLSFIDEPLSSIDEPLSSIGEKMSAIDKQQLPDLDLAARSLDRTSQKWRLENQNAA